MKVEVNLIKELKDKTDAGIMDCKEALLATNGDIEKAIDYLRKKGIAKATERMDRSTGEGIIESYIHPGARLGVLLDIRCETDFAARTQEFKQLAKDIAMQVAASNPKWISREDVPKEEVEHELEIYREQAKRTGKPEKVIEQIAKGKLDKFYKEVCLLQQPFIKNSEISVEELIKEYISKLRENIRVKRFVRFRIEE
ncbi:MAG: translation elongation factor Ts [bacterium]|nr:translation elongation factor Ts [bacterium]